MEKSLKFLLFILVLASCDAMDSSTESTSPDKWWTQEDRQLVISELNRTTDELRKEIQNLTDIQWAFREDPTRWSIAEVVEHLEMQNQLHYREVSAVSKAPQYLKYRSVTAGKDSHFTNYSTDTTRSKAQWFLEPLGRFCSKENGEAAFYRARKELTLFVEKTEIDLRKQFTFRTPVEGKELSDIQIGQVRDLHQLLLTGIAHTDRHLRQIRKIKEHPEYPKYSVK